MGHKKKTVLDLDLFDQELLSLANQWVPDVPPGSLKQGKLAQFKGWLSSWFEEIQDGYHYFELHGSEDIQKKLKLHDGGALLEAAFEENFVMAHPLNLTSDDLESLYELACSQVEGNLQLAKRLFMCLIFFNYTDVRYWIGLAALYGALHDFSTAQKIHAISLYIGLNDPLPYLYYAHFLKMQNDPLVRVAIAEGKSRASNDPSLLKAFEKLEEEVTNDRRF